ncbi:DUF120 domain-containing protein [Candidatus Aenigmatarchaeota archaeon]
MKIQGKVTTGAMSGVGVIEKYKSRIKAILGFEPFVGTLDVTIEEEIDIELYATKRIEHILLDGKPHINAYFAPVVLIVHSDEGEKEEPCWAFCLPNAYDKKTIELISPNKLRDRYSLKDGDIVELTFFTKKEKKKKPVTKLVKKLIKKESRISR